ncbi:MAG: glycoside hydrolase family 2 TIM barrel-domain containing protein [Mariniphaga sp.]
MKKLTNLTLFLLISFSVFAQNSTNVIDLNGQWDFEQTSRAFPPQSFSRKCPVPGLIHLARPKIDSYEKLFRKPEQTVSEEASDYRQLGYAPMYSWYRKNIYIPAELEGKEAMLSILKSKYVTQVYVNGLDAGQSVSCYTPIDLKVTQALKFGAENEILIRVGERIWLPPHAAGSTDKEKVHYIPGIWDDVFLSFSGKQKIIKKLVLPSVKEKKVAVKLLIRNFYPQQVMYGDPMEDKVKADILIREKASGKELARGLVEGLTIRDNETQLKVEIPVENFKTWSPGDPFLYEAEIKLYDNDKLSDEAVVRFGMRDFERRGKYFYLNDEKYYLRGSNITLHRFFEDPDCQALPWDREWVKKMLIDDPKSIDWNAMRICVGIAPRFWYELADEHGMVFQNEWLYWQNHGWDEQIRKEFTDWVWSDGNHPSIVIWDAINENWNSYIGNTLIPELQQLDPTRIWDAGYMQESDLSGIDPMDEPHLYRAGWHLMQQENPLEYLKKNPYLLGKLDDWEPNHLKYLEASATQLVNEYGWNWLWRDGRPAKLTKNMYDSLLGENASPEQRREMQAYWLACETEWIRAERTMAGVLSFCHLTNNYGYTGDWYINEIKNLEPGISFRWFKHAFAPANVFIDLPDQRYFPNGNYLPGEKLNFNLSGINDLKHAVKGTITLKLLNQDGEIIIQKISSTKLEPYRRVNIPTSVNLPETPGGYLLLSEFKEEGSEDITKSRRYLRIGNQQPLKFYEIAP